MQRRDFLLGALAAAAATAAPGIVQAKIASRPQQLSLYHTHTSESLDIQVGSLDQVSGDAHGRLNRFLRDFRTEEVYGIDPELFKLLTDLKQRAGNPDGVFEIISAYRSPKTNNMLRGKSGGVARKSLHMQGKALDIRLRGTPTSTLRDLAINLKRGGVGYYRSSDFIHVDTGRVRRW